METMQGTKKQPEPVERAKSFQERERERIADEYDRKNRRGIYAEVTDPDAPDYFLDEDERRELYAEKLTGPESFFERSKATRERMYAESTPKLEPAEEEVNPFDDRPAAQAAMEDFRAAHPEITDEDWEAMNSPSFYLKAPDVPELREQMIASGSRAAMDKVLQRALDGYETYKVQQARRAGFERIAKARFATRGM